MNFQSSENDRNEGGRGHLSSLRAAVHRGGTGLWERLPWPRRPLSRSEILGIIALPLTLLWLLTVLLAESRPAVGKDATRLFFLMLVMMLPAILALLAGTYSMCRWTRRGDSGQRNAWLGPKVMALAGFAWLSVTLLLFSEPTAEFEASAVWAWYTFMFGVLWLAIISLVAYRMLRVPNIRTVEMVIAYLAPLAVTLTALVLLVAYDLPIKARFELSEGALYRASQDGLPRNECPRGTCKGQLVGFFHVQDTYQRGGCVILETQSFFSESGFAYCTGRLPIDPVIKMHHLTGCWWRFSGDSWKEHYEAVRPEPGPPECAR